MTTGGFIGVDGVARRIRKAYVGVAGVARPIIDENTNIPKYYGEVATLDSTYSHRACAATKSYVLNGLGVLSSADDNTWYHNGNPKSTMTAYDKNFVATTVPNVLSCGAVNSARFNDVAVLAGGTQQASNYLTSGGAAFLEKGYPNVCKILTDDLVIITADAPNSNGPYLGVGACRDAFFVFGRQFIDRYGDMDFSTSYVDMYSSDYTKTSVFVPPEYSFPSSYTDNRGVYCANFEDVVLFPITYRHATNSGGSTSEIRVCALSSSGYFSLSGSTFSERTPIGVLSDSIIGMSISVETSGRPGNRRHYYSSTISRVSKDGVSASVFSIPQTGEGIMHGAVQCTSDFGSCIFGADTLYYLNREFVSTKTGETSFAVDYSIINGGRYNVAGVASNYAVMFEYNNKLYSYIL